MSSTTFNDSPSREIAPEADSFAWFAVHTRTRFEKKVASNLQEKGIETFLPLFSAKHQWSDRQRLVHEPVFPTYVFVRIAATQDIRVAVLRTIGVTSFVGVRGIGTPIPDGEIQAIHRVLEQRVPFELHPFLKVGQRVRVRGGCLDGIEGILTAINGDENLVVSVQLIQRAMALRVSGYQIEPVGWSGNPVEPGLRTAGEKILSANAGIRHA